MPRLVARGLMRKASPHMTGISSSVTPPAASAAPRTCLTWRRIPHTTAHRTPTGKPAVSPGSSRVCPVAALKALSDLSHCRVEQCFPYRDVTLVATEASNPAKPGERVQRAAEEGTVVSWTCKADRKEESDEREWWVENECKWVAVIEKPENGQTEPFV